MLKKKAKIWTQRVPAAEKLYPEIREATWWSRDRPDMYLNFTQAKPDS